MDEAIKDLRTVRAWAETRSRWHIGAFTYLCARASRPADQRSQRALQIARRLLRGERFDARLLNTVADDATFALDAAFASFPSGYLGLAAHAAVMALYRAFGYAPQYDTFGAMCAAEAVENWALVRRIAERVGKLRIPVLWLIRNEPPPWIFRCPFNGRDGSSLPLYRGGGQCPLCEHPVPGDDHGNVSGAHVVWFVEQMNKPWHERDLLVLLYLEATAEQVEHALRVLEEKR